MNRKKSFVVAAIAAIVVAGMSQAGPGLGPAPDRIRVVTIDSPAPLVQIEVMVRAGSSDDPQGYEGTAYLTAKMLLEGSFGDPQAPVTKEKLAETTRPWGSAAKPSVRVAKETTTFYMTVPKEVLDEYIRTVLKPLFTQPLFADEELERIRKETVEYVSSSIRYENTELLGLFALDNYVHEGTSYAHLVYGTLKGLAAVDRDMVRRFYATYYRPDNLTVGLSTRDPQVVDRITKALGNVGEAESETKALPPRKDEPPPAVTARSLVIISKPNATSTGLHAAFPISVKRGDPDYWPLYVANVFLGTHRDSFGRLYTRIRSERGYNYGDYSYIEWFDGRPFYLFPPPNTPRRYQYFSIWIRPVAHQYAHHILKAFSWELENFVRNGMTAAELQLAKTKAKVLYLSLAENTQRLVAYKLDDLFYGLGDKGYLDMYLDAIDAVTLEEVNAAIRRHLSSQGMKYVIITSEEWADRLAKDIASDRNARGKSLLDYNFEFETTDADTLWKLTRGHLDIVQMDKVYETYWLDIPESNIRVVKAADLFETPALLP
jgi:zinc protease